jgi:hypothetical protein
METMLHELQGNVMVCVQGDVPLEDSDWDAFLASVTASPSLRAFLISADNHGPNATQRAKLATLTGVFLLPKAVVTTSLAVRGIVTATSWLGTNIRSFSPNHIDNAFEYLGVAEPLRAALLGRVALLKTRLAGGEISEHLSGTQRIGSSDLHLMQTLVEERVANIRANLRTVRRGR